MIKCIFEGITTKINLGDIINVDFEDTDIYGKRGKYYATFMIMDINYGITEHECVIELLSTNFDMFGTLTHIEFIYDTTDKRIEFIYCIGDEGPYDKYPNVNHVYKNVTIHNLTNSQ